MADKSWKKAERDVSKFFGSTRTPLSGGNSKTTRSDTLHPAIFVEVKRHKRNALYSLYASTKELAKKEYKIPVICIKEPGKKGFLIVVHSQDFEALAITRADYKE